MSKYYNVGSIVNTQGLKGEVRIKSLSDFSEERFKKNSLLSLFDPTDQFVRELKVTRGRQQKNLWIVKFAGLDSINDVEKFKGFNLKIHENDLSDLEDNEFYYHEIIGLEVFEKDEKIGTIAEILQPGANDVWLVKREGKKDLLLPYIESVILKVSVENKRVDVEIPEGLDE